MIRVELNNFQYFLRYTLKISGQYVYDTWIKRKKNNSFFNFWHFTNSILLIHLTNNSILNTLTYTYVYNFDSQLICVDIHAKIPDCLRFKIIFKICS